MLSNLQLVKIKAIDSADVDGADNGVTPSRLVEDEHTTCIAESVPGSLFGFKITAIVPHILFTLDFYGIL